MTSLETNLREIIEQKNNVIIPENIKKDVEIFGVTGSYELEDYDEMFKISLDILGIEYVQENLETFYDAINYTSGNTLTDEIDGESGEIYGIEGTDYQKGDLGIELNGGYIKTQGIDKVYGTWEILCKVNSDFTPQQYTAWYNCSCILGNEIGDTQQDFAVIIDKNGYFAIGYANSSIKSSSVKANDGKYHHIMITYENGVFELYVDNKLIATQTYTMSGRIPAYMGIFYNGVVSTTNVKGEVLYYRYYSRKLTEEEREINYSDAIYNYLGGV